MNYVELIWFFMGVMLLIYVISGGADFGAGVWYLVARGSQSLAERRAIRAALAPIWEANHVWLIFIVVLCFTVFPRAFAVMSTALHIPLTLALLGIVLRGSAFVLHAYGLGPHQERRWGTIFAISSVATPVFLGMVLSALSSGDIRVDNGNVISGYFSGWLEPFSFVLGIFVLTVFALLAAVYLTVDSPTEVRESFRRKALLTQLLLVFISLITLALVPKGASIIWRQFHGSPMMWLIMAINGLTVMGTLFALWRHHYYWARCTVVAQVGLIILGWGLGMRGFIIYPDITLAQAGARSETIASLVVGIPVGLAIIIPSLWVLFWIFKRAS